MDLQLNTFVRKPFTVEAIQVTQENIAAVTQMLNGLLGYEEDGTPFIQMDKKVVANFSVIRPGFWVTKMGDNVRVYVDSVFRNQFVEMDDNVEGLIGILNGTN